MARTALDIVTRQIRTRLRREGLGLVASGVLVAGLGGAPALALLLPTAQPEPTFTIDLPRAHDVAFLVLASAESPDEVEPADEPEPVPEPRPRKPRKPRTEERVAPVEVPAEVLALAVPVPAPPPQEEGEEEADDAIADADAQDGQEDGEEDGQADAPAPEQPASPPVAKEPRGRGRCGPDHPDIRALGPDRFEVERELVQYHTASIKRIQALAGGGPFRDADHGVKGWQIRNFGCKSPLYKGGLRNHDVIQAVNGRKTNNVAQILGVWLGQRNRTDFEIQVLRKGRALTLHYRLI